MRKMSLALALAVAVLLTAAAAPEAEETGQTEEAAEEAVAVETVPLAEPGREVQMAELSFQRGTVVGRVLEETEDTIRIELLGGGVTGYPRGAAQEIKRFTMGLLAYYEARGDLHHDEAWLAEDAADRFVRARQEYRRALRHAETPEDGERLADKLDLLARDRIEWQEEALRREELERARHQTELAELQKELAREELRLVERHDREIRQLQRSDAELAERLRLLAEHAARLEDAVIELDEDVDWLQRRNRVLVTETIIVDLRREYDDLRRKMDRLERQMQGD